MTTSLLTTDSTALSALVAPEDLRIGDFISALNEIVEYPSFLWCDPVPGESGALVRVRHCAAGAGTPLKIKAICLPFVYVKSPTGSTETLDVRQVQLVRLKKRYSKTIWSERRNRDSRKKKRNKGSKGK